MQDNSNVVNFDAAFSPIALDIFKIIFLAGHVERISPILWPMKKVKTINLSPPVSIQYCDTPHTLVGSIGR